MKAEWRFAMINSGAQCVEFTGIHVMHKWPVGNWDTSQWVL